jgi:hypothetical protein
LPTCSSKRSPPLLLPSSKIIKALVVQMTVVPKIWLIQFQPKKRNASKDNSRSEEPKTKENNQRAGLKSIWKKIGEDLTSTRAQLRSSESLLSLRRKKLLTAKLSL